MPPAVVAPPPTPVEPVTETLHGVEVTDPYRWLEDQNSPRIREWLGEQTACDARPIYKATFWHRFDTTRSLLRRTIRGCMDTTLSGAGDVSGPLRIKS